MRDVLAPYLKNNYPNNRYYAAEPEFALFTKRDIFEKDVWIYPGKELPLKEMIAGDVLIYDSLVMSEERHFDLNQIRLGSDLIEDTLFSYENSRGQWINCYIFLKP